MQAEKGGDFPSSFPTSVVSLLLLVRLPIHDNSIMVRVEGVYLHRRTGKSAVLIAPDTQPKESEYNI